MESLIDKVVLVTGGGTGIDRGVALAFAQEGVRVVICGRCQDPKTETANVIWQIGGGALAIQTDVSKEEDVQRLVNGALDSYGRVDIQVNNAGIFEDASTYKMNIKSWDRMIEVNLRGPMLMIRYVVPHMREKRSGHIIKY